MPKIPIKILSYIANFRKIIFPCPLCYEINSTILPEGEPEEHEFKCDHCRKTFTGDLSSLKNL